MIKERIKDKALRVCDTCGHEQWVNYWNIYRKDIHLCRYCNNQITAKTRKQREYSPPWNLGTQKNLGSTYINNNGYVEVCLSRIFQENASLYAKEHRLLVEVDLGRRLVEKEIVHHVDGDKTNNVIENLYVCQGHKVHRNIHSQLERVSMGLVQSGAIKFNHKDGQYYLDPNVRECISKLGELLETPEKDNQQRSFSEMSEEERSTTIQKWSTLK